MELQEMENPKTDTTYAKMIKGIAVSRGIVRATAYVLPGDSRFSVPKRNIGESDIKKELDRFEATLKEAEAQVLALQKNVKEKIGRREAEIFNVQLLVLKDPSFLNEVSRGVISKRVNIEAALSEVLEKFSRMMTEINDPYLRERASDIRDIGRRVLAILMKQKLEEGFSLPEGLVVVADELLPSATAHLELQKVRGFVTEKGGKASHASILARSLGIPAVIGVKEATLKIKTGDSLIVDGMAGTVFVNPKRSVVAEYEKLEADFRSYRESLKNVIDLPARTQDGVQVKIYANIGKVAEAEAALLFTADGIGLYRTEFTFLIRDTFPTEEEQYGIYKTSVECLNPRPVFIRVLDLGGDKELPYFPLPKEKNPSLGQRGVQLLLRHPAILKTQLRAILRTSGDYPVGILLPMVSSLDEVLEVKKLLESIKKELLLEKHSFNRQIPLGVMIETPAAAVIAEKLAKASDFLSIGTNDLIQYILAADRTSQEMVSYYEPLHPSVLQMIKVSVDGAGRAGREISICGEMAGEAAYTELLLGLGLRNFSVAPGEILEVKQAIRSVDIQKAEGLAKRILELSTIQEIQACLKEKEKGASSQVA